MVIDLWVESLLINFFLNIPSQLYTTFRGIRSLESLKYENAEGEEEIVFKKIKL